MRLDNKSSSLPIVMYGSNDIANEVTLTSFAFDTADYDKGVTIGVAIQAGASAVVFTCDIQTSPNLVGANFTTVNNDELIGGNQLVVNDANNDTEFPEAPRGMITRGLINQDRYVRVAFSSIAAGVDVAVIVTLIAGIEVAPTSNEDTIDYGLSTT